MKHTRALFILSTIFSTTLLTGEDVALTAKNEGCSDFYDAVLASGIYEHAKKQVGENDSLAPFTVFAPTNAACAALKELDPKEKKAILTLHVVPGRKITSPSDDMADGVATVGHQALIFKEKKVTLEDGTTSASIIKGPIEAQNGLVSVIDTVLFPAGKTAPKVEQKKAPEATAPKPALKEKTPAAPQETAAAAAPLVSEQTAQTLISSITQLTQSIQLLIHVIQQAQMTADSTPPQQKAA